MKGVYKMRIIKLECLEDVTIDNILFKKGKMYVAKIVDTNKHKHLILKVFEKIGSAIKIREGGFQNAFS